MRGAEVRGTVIEDVHALIEADTQRRASAAPWDPEQCVAPHALPSSCRQARKRTLWMTAGAYSGRAVAQVPPRCRR